MKKTILRISILVLCAVLFAGCTTTQVNQKQRLSKMLDMASFGAYYADTYGDEQMKKDGSAGLEMMGMHKDFIEGKGSKSPIMKTTGDNILRGYDTHVIQGVFRRIPEGKVPQRVNEDYVLLMSYWNYILTSWKLKPSAPAKEKWIEALLILGKIKEIKQESDKALQEAYIRSVKEWIRVNFPRRN